MNCVLLVLITVILHEKIVYYADIEKYGYPGYGIGFDRRSSFSFPGGGFGQNVLIFVVDMSSSAHIDTKKKDILVLGKGPTEGLEQINCRKIVFN